MKKLFTLSFLCILLLPLVAFKFKKEDSHYRIIGYAASWINWNENSIDAEKLTHINYAFALLDTTGIVKKPTFQDSVNLVSLTTLRSKNTDLKVLISIGGWGADYFSNAALTSTSRKAFAKSALAFLTKHKLDGIDIDWEYPGQSGAGNIFRKEDKQNFTLLLKELREQLDAKSNEEGRSGDRKYLLTAATGGDKEFLKHTELSKVHVYLDFINIMTYDLYNGFDKETGHHSGLYHSSRGGNSRNSSADAVDGHIRAGVPPNKIVLGIPFYGRGWLRVKDKNNGLFMPAEGTHITMSYDSLKAAYINKNGYVRYWDDKAKVPYLWNQSSHTFITYSDLEAMEHKINYIKKKRLGGAMFWECSNNAEGELMDKLYSGLNESSQDSFGMK